MVPTPVTEVNVTAYIGKWYQAYGSRSVSALSTYGSCITAEYTVTDVDGTIGVKNTGYIFGQFFPGADFLRAVSINGFAVQSSTVPGQLQVSFGSIPFVSGALGFLHPENAPYQEPGNYWIFELTVFWINCLYFTRRWWREFGGDWASQFRFINRLC